MEQRFWTDPELDQMYRDLMREYFTLWYMISASPLLGPYRGTYFLRYEVQVIAIDFHIEDGFQ